MLTYFFGVLAPSSGGHYLYLNGQQLTQIADGWTLLACWDRSADRRGGCCATWAVQTIDRDAPFAQIRQFYGPTVARIEAHVGKPLDKWPLRRLLEDYPLASGSALYSTTKPCTCCNGTGRMPRA